jgi:hypothetical protein
MVMKIVTLIMKVVVAVMTIVNKTTTQLVWVQTL